MTQEVRSSNTRIEASSYSEYHVNISTQPDDSMWDSFLAGTQGGHHVQTSLWAQLKATLGYRALRVVISHSDRAILSGAQILFRSFPPVGNVGFVSKGPLFASSDPVLQERTIQELLRAASRTRIHYLIVQPPNNGETQVNCLIKHGFQPVNINLAPVSTIVIDVSKDLDVLLKEMKPRTRYNIRLGEKKGMTVRQGTEQDLLVFYEFLKATSRRQDFSIYSYKYYEKLWQLFHPQGFAHLLVVEFEGEPVSARLSISFGDTVINKLSVWSGQHGKNRPNETLQWADFKWAKENGYRYYDLEGINIDEVKAGEDTEKEESTNPQGNSVTSFKMGFGGQLTLYPKAYVYFANPLLRLVYRFVYPKVADSRLVRKLISHLRTN